MATYPMAPNAAAVWAITALHAARLWGLPDVELIPGRDEWFGPTANPDAEWTPAASDLPDELSLDADVDLDYNWVPESRAPKESWLQWMLQWTDPLESVSFPILGSATRLGFGTSAELGLTPATAYKFGFIDVGALVVDG